MMTHSVMLHLSMHSVICRSWSFLSKLIPWLKYRGRVVRYHRIQQYVWLSNLIIPSQFKWEGVFPSHDNSSQNLPKGKCNVGTSHTCCHYHIQTPGSSWGIVVSAVMVNTFNAIVFNFSLWDSVWNSTSIIYNLTCDVSIACSVVMKQTLSSLHKILNLPEIWSVFFISFYCEIQNFSQAMNDCMLIVPYCDYLRVYAGFQGNVQPPAPSRQLNNSQHAIIKNICLSCCGQCWHWKLAGAIFHFQLGNLDLER